MHDEHLKQSSLTLTTIVRINEYMIAKHTLFSLTFIGKDSIWNVTINNTETPYSYSCRPYEWPFYFGFIAPFVAIYIFNWIMFIVIITSLCRHAAKRETADFNSVVTRQLFIAIVLSLLFGLGWAFGLIGSSSLPSGVSITGQYIFSIFIGFQGVLIFFLHAVRSTDVREEWKRWWYWITCRTEHYRIYQTTSKVSGSRSKTGTLPTRLPT